MRSPKSFCILTRVRSSKVNVYTVRGDTCNACTRECLFIFVRERRKKEAIRQRNVTVDNFSNTVRRNNCVIIIAFIYIRNVSFPKKIVYRVIFHIFFSNKICNGSPKKIIIEYIKKLPGGSIKKWLKD